MNKTVLITGASRGIGKATAEAFAKNGYRVIINYFQSKKEAEQLCEELKGIGCDCLTVQADVSKEVQVSDMMGNIRNFSSHIDVLVNNAGVDLQKMLIDTTQDEWDRLFDINVKGMFNCCRAVLPEMVKKKYGKIVNISSILGVNGASCEVAYSATKAAVIGFTKALAKEVGPCGINVNCVAPGVVMTDMMRKLGEEALQSLKEATSLGVIGTPEDIAESVLFLASDKSKFITGQILSPNGGLVI